MVKVYMIPLQNLQLHIMQQVLRKLPVRSLCRLRKTCKFFNSHVEEYKNMFASRLFDKELDLLWSFRIACPSLWFHRSFPFYKKEVIVRWYKYNENTKLDSNFDNCRETTSHIAPYDRHIEGKFSAVTFDTITVAMDPNHFLLSQNDRIDLRLQALNLHCHTLCPGDMSFRDMEVFTRLIKHETLQISYTHHRWEHFLEQLATLSDHSKIHILSYGTHCGHGLFESIKRFQRFTTRLTYVYDFEFVLNDIYKTTESYNIKSLQLHVGKIFNLTFEMPFDTLWNRSKLSSFSTSASTILFSSFVYHTFLLIPHFIYRIQTQNKIALLTVYKNITTDIFIDIVENSEEAVLTILKRKLRIWKSRRDREYLSANVNRRKQILIEEFLVCRV